MKNKTLQLVLPVDTPAPADLLDESPDQVKADLRKFNRTQAIVDATVRAIKEFPLIKSHEDVARAQELLKTASGLKNKVNSKRLELSKPYRDQADRINECANKITEQVQPSIDALKARILVFSQAEARRLQQQENGRRHQQLLGMGLVFFDKGRPDYPAPHYSDDTTGRNVYRMDVESLSGPLWEEVLKGLLQAREDLREAKVSELAFEIAAADFFGEDTGALQQQLQEVKTAPTSYVPVSATAATAPNVRGLTRRWAFEVLNEQEVPRAYLKVNEEKIREEIAAGARSIPGVRIYQTESISIR